MEFDAKEFFDEQSIEAKKEVFDLQAKTEMLEKKIKSIDLLNKEVESIKQQIYGKMIEFGVKTWEMPSGTKITVAYPQPQKVSTVKVFDEEKFKEENPSEYQKYAKTQEKVTNAKSGYLRITQTKD